MLMKKNLFLLLFLSLFMFMTISCEKKDNLLEDEVVLENIKYKLDQDDSEYGIKYKVASNFRKTTLVNAINYFSEKINNSSYFVIRIYHYPGKDIEYAIKDSVEKVEKREEIIIGDKEYTKVYFTNYNGAKTHLFYYKYNNTVYTYVFTSGIDLSRLEDIFLKNVEYDKY